METYTEFSRKELDVGRVLALADLIYECKKQDVEIDKVIFTMNGFMVTFTYLPGDAVLHDGSYGRWDNTWETVGLPWDNDDISVHDSDTLAKLLGALKRGEDWECIVEPERCADCEFTGSRKCVDCGIDDDDVLTDEEFEQDDFLAAYNKLTAALKMQAATDMKNEEDRHGN